MRNFLILLSFFSVFTIACSSKKLLPPSFRPDFIESDAETVKLIILSQDYPTEYYTYREDGKAENEEMESAEIKPEDFSLYELISADEFQLPAPGKNKEILAVSHNIIVSFVTAFPDGTAYLKASKSFPTPLYENTRKYLNNYLSLASVQRHETEKQLIKFYSPVLNLSYGKPFFRVYADVIYYTREGPDYYRVISTVNLENSARNSKDDAELLAATDKAVKQLYKFIF